MSAAVTLVSAPQIAEPGIKFSVVLEILGDAIDSAGAINGKGPTGEGAERRATEAQYSRALLNLADQLTLASSLVRNEYWSAKGHTSYDL